MHPILIDLGPLHIHTFGVLMGSGFLVGILWSMRLARKWGIDPEEIFNLTFWIMLAGIGGARLLYVLIDIGQKGWDSEFVDPHHLRDAIVGWIAIWEGGLVWYGGFIGAALLVLFYARKKKMPILRVMDLLAPGTFCGLAIGRIGCLMAGDDFGRPTTMPWGLVFHNPDALIYPKNLIGVPLHPTQNYMEAKSFTVATLCFLFLKYKKRVDGQVLALALMIYAPLRAFIEIYRGDYDRGFIPGTHDMLSTSQGIGIVVFFLGVALFVALTRRARPPRVAAPPAT